jgi:hypothetical protein
LHLRKDKNSFLKIENLDFSDDKEQIKAEKIKSIYDILILKYLNTDHNKTLPPDNNSEVKKK